MDFKKFGGILQKKTTLVASLLSKKFLFDTRNVPTLGGTGKEVKI
jgi:hypothetical protein